MMDRKLDKDGRVRVTLAFKPEAFDLLETLCKQEVRSKVGELTFLLGSRARELGLGDWHVGEEDGE